MNFFAAFHMPHKAKSAPATDGAETQFELQILTLHNLAADIADCASAANFAAGGGATQTLTACRKVFPPPYDATRRRDDIAVRSSDPTYWVGVLQRGVSHTMHVTDLAALPGSRDAVALADCARLWRELGWLAMTAVDAMEPEARWRIAGRFSENALVVHRTFREISSGQWPCTDASGVINRLMLPQRRRLPRFALKKRCRIFSGHRVVDATTLDVSTGGIGIATNAAFELKSDVVVEIDGGRRVAGHVAWLKPGRLGMQFADDLATDDPLLAG